MMNKAALTLLFATSALFLATPLLSQPFEQNISLRVKKRMDEDRRITIKDLKKALRRKDDRSMLHTMGVLMRSYYDKDSAEEVAEALIRVLYIRDQACTPPKKTALANLAQIGPTGIMELERALKCRLRRADPRFRIQAIATLAEAKVPSSWSVLLAMGRDSNQMVAVAAVKALPNFTHIPRRELRCMVARLARLLRPPTKEEIKKDLDLPPLQKTVRQTLTRITGAKIQKASEWHTYLRTTWVRQGCPVKSGDKKKKRKSQVSATQK
jgi:hypothetical protein